ncbi:MAG: radical SAM protein [Candidatus Lernaella stagnicola]|nr:radical SAM protein [Candidatus Lernaella stagnicola]
MRFLLIQAATYFPETEKCFPVGTLQLAAYVRETLGATVGFFDMQHNVRDVAPVIEAVRRFCPDVVGISAMTVDQAAMHAVAKAVKAHQPDLPVIAGGSHPTTYPGDTLARGDIDFAIRGEGEIGAAALLRHLQGELPRDEVPNLVWLENGELQSNEAAPWIEKLDSLPFAAYDLADLEAYYKMPRTGVIWARRRYAAVSTSRGCPYRCAYCHRVLGKRWRPRSPRDVVDELEQLVARYRIGEIVFVDDMFNLDKARVQEICRLIRLRRLDLKLAFPIGLRGDIMDEETIRALVDAGMFRCMYAVETASPRLQTLISKNLNLDRVLEVIDTTNRYGVLTHGTFMLGFPTETEAEMRDTIALAERSMLATAAFFRVIPFGDTELVALARKYGASVPDDFTRFEFHKSKVNVSPVSDEVVDHLKKLAYFRFYVSPRRFWRVLRRLPNIAANLPHLMAIWWRKTFLW